MQRERKGYSVKLIKGFLHRLYGSFAHLVLIWTVFSKESILANITSKENSRKDKNLWRKGIRYEKLLWRLQIYSKHWIDKELVSVSRIWLVDKIKKKRNKKPLFHIEIRTNTSEGYKQTNAFFRHCYIDTRTYTIWKQFYLSSISMKAVSYDHCHGRRIIFR